MVLERHHSRRICLMLLALDTPKLCDRFSLGLESTGLRRLWKGRMGCWGRTGEPRLLLLSPRILYLLLASESSLSNTDRRAWAPMLRGSVCDLWSSRLLSPHDLSPCASASLQRTKSREVKSSARRPVLCHLTLTCHAAAALSRSQTSLAPSLKHSEC